MALSDILSPGNRHLLYFVISLFFAVTLLSTYAISQSMVATQSRIEAANDRQNIEDKLDVLSDVLLHGDSKNITVINDPANVSLIIPDVTTEISNNRSVGIASAGQAVLPIIVH